MMTINQQEQDNAARQAGLLAWTDGWDGACRAATAAGRMVKGDTAEARKAWAAVLMEAMAIQMAKTAASERRAAANAAAWYAALAAADIATRPRTEKDVPLRRKPRTLTDTELRVANGLEAGRSAWIETWDTVNLWK